MELVCKGCSLTANSRSEFRRCMGATVKVFFISRYASRISRAYIWTTVAGSPSRIVRTLTSFAVKELEL